MCRPAEQCAPVAVAWACVGHAALAGAVALHKASGLSLCGCMCGGVAGRTAWGGQGARTLASGWVCMSCANPVMCINDFCWASIPAAPDQGTCICIVFTVLKAQRFLQYLSTLLNALCMGWAVQSTS